MRSVNTTTTPKHARYRYTRRVRHEFDCIQDMEASHVREAGDGRSVMSGEGSDIISDQKEAGHRQVETTTADGGVLAFKGQGG